MLKKLLSKIFNFNQQIQTKIEWQQTNEPILLSWTNRGIIGNKKDIFWKKITFYGFFLCLIIFTSILLLTASKTMMDSLISLLIMLVFYIPFVTLGYFGIFEFKFYTYRITEKELELVCWKEDLLFGKQLAQGLLIIITPFLVIVFITEPTALLVSLGGMAGVGILAGATLFSKGYIESHLNYQHMITRWDSLLKIEIDNRGKPIILVWGKDFYDKKQRVDLFNLFCNPEIFDEIVKLIQQQVNEEELEKGIHYCETWG
ncbi:hypothetical protein MTZ49_08730 [Entomomonas sp. E2T0]|uniref:hypothetical protein n=1 Tax=Entomomonas sp. E2T0 TaxID=2930213 RepID=UPI0022282669|nr:hypothetical protein [Entomomonas sp. E2T0]UYZ82701.1 hypothetical protein MTZ49_08730 [Entomomonas sp. E2T0]